MKSLVLLSLFCAAPALANPLSFEGEFVAPKHKVTFRHGYDIVGCTEENGEWHEGKGCVFKGENNLSVVKNGTTWFARISTISPNASLCDFEGEAVQVSPNVLLAKAEGEQFVPGARSGTGSWIPAVCEVQISYRPDGSVSVREKDFRKCASFCGATAFLSIPTAARKTKLSLK